MKTEEYLHAYKLMLMSKYSDYREGVCSRQGKSFLQVPSRGHEALGLLTLQLNSDDVLVPYWRNKALVLGKTHNLSGIAKDFFAVASSSSGGRNMPSHFSDKSNNVFSVVTSTGMQCLPACGIAWSFLQRNQSSIVMCSIGDGATRQGEFFEAWCFAKEKKLPIIFLVEDNQYAISTPTEKTTPLSLDVFDCADIITIDGSDPVQLFHHGEEAVSKARKGKPSIMWCRVDRLESHTNSDDCTLYRCEEDLLSMVDPIEKMEDFMLKNSIIQSAEIEKFHKSISLEVDETYAAAESEMSPDPGGVKSFLYNEDPSREHSLQIVNRSNMTIVEAVNNALHEGFDRSDDVVGFGNDVEDPKGGVFGFTKGISRKHPRKMFNAPLSESTIVGTAVGLAACGIKPIFEIQFVDFLGVAFEQLVTQVATLSWRSLGEWTAPLVLYAPYGAYLPGGGMWHSQSNEGFWCHIPGLRIAIPSNPQDAYELFSMSFQLLDPILILLPKHIMRKKFDIPKSPPLSFGRGKKVVSGADITVVAWGNCMSIITDVMEDINEHQVSVELIDPIFLNPLDLDLIKCSVVKTGRLLVVQEDNKTCSVGESIITKIIDDNEAFYALLAPPKLISRDDIHIPYHQDLEYAVLPDKKQILTSILTMVSTI